MPWSLPHSREPELMDDPTLAEADHFHALSALARINAVSRTAARLAAGVRGMLRRERDEAAPRVVVDVACGGGDVTLGIARRLRRAFGGDGVRLVGVDFSPRALARARQAAVARGIEAAFEFRDVLADGCPPCDVAVSSLFLHHLDDGAAGRLLRSMSAAARHGIVVSDLVRSRIGLGLAVVGTTILTSSRVARIDGPLSVRAARTPAEYRRLCDEAGLEGATIRRSWPERVVIHWRRHAARSR
jgi:SAM-dependent methyltransferase